MVRIGVFLLFVASFLRPCSAFRCPETKTPQCSCQVLKNKHLFLVSAQEKGVISCSGSAVDDMFLDNYSGAVVESHSFCRDDESPDSGNEVESESRNRRTASRLKDRTQALGSLGPPHCAVSRLSINRTNIRSLNQSLLSNLYVDEIRLVQNPHLETINFLAFNLSRQSLRTLEISQAKVPLRETVAFASNFQKLESLKLALGIEALDKFTFERGKLRHLKELDLSDNQISKIADFSFFELPNLKVLRLTRNNVHSVSSHMLTFAPPVARMAHVKLHILLDYNRLSSDLIDQRSLSSFLRPVTLDLSHNNMHSLPMKPFRTFLYSDPKNTVDVRGNPFLCDQESQWIRDHVLYLNYSRGGTDEDVNPEYRTEIIGDLTFLYERTKPDFSFYKIRDMTCENNSSIFAPV